MSKPDLESSLQTLDLPHGAGLSEVKQAYRDLMNVWHPDRFSHDPRLRKKCEDKVKEINAAYRFLESLARLSEVHHQPAAPPETAARAASMRTVWEDLEPVQLNHRWGYVDPSGRVIIRPLYGSAGRFSEAVAAVELNGQFGYIDPRGDWVIEARFQSADEFHEGRALVCAGRYGYIDLSGHFAVRPRFDGGRRFQDGYAAVKVGEKWGYIRIDGSWLTELVFDEAHDFSNGRGYARQGRRWAYVSRAGEIRPLE
jgi:curved DNA-binding protein CbpA